VGFNQEWRYRTCPWCNAQDVEMPVIASWNHADARGTQRYWSALVCRRCAGPVLIEHDNPQTGEFVLIRVIPEGREGALMVSNLPEDVEAYYTDAITVLQAGVPDAAAVQLRRTLEAAAAHFKVKSSPLVAAIRELIKQGLVTTQFGEVLGHIRVVGNIGAHASDKRVDRETADRALRFTTQVLRNLFEIPAQLRELGIAPPEETAEKAEE
jgi:uncharacterized protein DUF4145